MKTFRQALVMAIVGAALAVALAAATPQAARILDHDVYEIWRGIANEALSADGRWAMYTLTLQHGDPELVVRSLEDDRQYGVPRGTEAAFDAAGEYVVMLVRPAMADTRQARIDKVDEAERPKSALGILDLATGRLTTIERVKSFLLPEHAGTWVAYLQEEPLEVADDTDAAIEPPASAPEAASDEAEPSKSVHEETGTTLTRRTLRGDDETSFEHVIDYAVANDGRHLAYATATREGDGDGVFVVATERVTAHPALIGAGHYKRLLFDDAGEQLAFLSDRDEFDAEADADVAQYVLYRATPGSPATALASSSTAGLPSGWQVSEHRQLQFSDRGTRLYFGTAEAPAPEVDEPPMLDEEKVKVDIWHWRDPLLQPMQLLQAGRESERSFVAVAHLDDGQVVQLANRQLPDVELLDGGEADFVYGRSSLPYRLQSSWDFPGTADHYVIDVRSGEQHRIAVAHQGPYEVSPDGAWAVWWDAAELAWFGRALAPLADGSTAPSINLTAQIGQAVHNEQHDWAYEPMPYGLAGWLREDDGSVEAVVYDRYDLWAVDPGALATPRHITSGLGRERRTRLRWIELDPDEHWMPSTTLLLSAFDENDKSAGFWDVEAFGPLPPQQQLHSAHRYGQPRTAKAADVVLFTRENVGEFPDVWAGDLDLVNARRISDANPQQAEYNWATAEVTSWRSLDGELLQGLIHKPADFDPTKKYPMMVTFYERNSDNLHQHHAPTPHRSVIRQTFYASRGYIVFTPDITYQVGYPGESALKDVVAGVLHMIDQGYVDERNIGAQGHSWGGYQIAYLVTKSNIFKAAAGGAPVANMTSAYGGIRWGSGMSRMFQYEKTQSRLGATLWEAPMRYLENSPLFWADKVETPLMMMHNDHDAAVPWYQGIEMFVALRRLGKPTWLINYNDEPHWPTTHANKVDWNIRMQQFFDHYLKDAPAPRWLQEGLPAIDKGKTLGLELLDRDGR